MILTSHSNLHESCPSILGAFSTALPLDIPSSFYKALNVLRAFTHTVTPNNPSLPRYSSLAAQFTINYEQHLLGAKFELSTSGIDTERGLLNVPSEKGYRAFDVFYYLYDQNASKAEKEFLNLKPTSSYALLRRSGTFNPPSYLPAGDDAAASHDFRADLRAIGITGERHMTLLMVLAGLLKLGDSLDYSIPIETLRSTCEDAASLLELDPVVLQTRFDASEREVFIAGVYEAIVDWVIKHINEAMKKELAAMRQDIRGHIPGSASLSSQPELDEDTVCINIINIPDVALGKAVALRTVFDDNQGINAEMKQDGVIIKPAGASVLAEMKSAVAACGPDLGDMDSPIGRERDIQKDRREGILDRVAQRAAADSFMKDLLHPTSQGVVLGSAGRFHLSNTLNSSRTWFQLNIHPIDESPSALTAANQWSAAAVSSQLRAWRLPEWGNRRNRALDFTADFDPIEFVQRYATLGCQDGKEGIETWCLERGWSNGEIVIGETRIWLRENAWWDSECLLDSIPASQGETPLASGYSMGPADSGFFPPGSRDNLLAASKRGPGSIAPTMMTVNPGEYGLGTKGDQYKGEVVYEGMGDTEMANGKVVESRPIGMSRRVWVFFTWLFTGWIPSPALRYIGRMKRPDVRMAWREKLFLVLIILFLNCMVVFYIIFFGKLLCPNWNKAWNTKEVGYHQGEQDYWVSHRGKVYDLTKFYKTQHSDTNIATTAQNMMPFAGTNMDAYINPPLTLACPNLVDSDSTVLSQNDTSAITDSSAIHISGSMQPVSDSKLHQTDWYSKIFLPKMGTMLKGDLVYTNQEILKDGQEGYRDWVVINNGVYDITNYVYTKNQIQRGNPAYSFFPDWFEEMVAGNAGTDITQQFNSASNVTERKSTMQCLENYFYTGKPDFRKSAKCQVNNYILLAFTIILCVLILVKFLAALQLGSKKRPSQQEKFVICQVPAYTEGEDQLRKGLDSLTALAYDNKRKLICVICDGVIVGKGNDRPTPKIVLDILGVDPKVDPPALPFKSVGAGSEQLNYGKVYSGLYEFEGNVVPYLVVVKVGKESEQSKAKPGNRGKRDSQVLLMSFLNRVHHRSPMSPLELEMFHQISNVIGVDPELYEYLFMVDADTMVEEESLNRLVAACANDAKIAGICGETSLQNEERSWWTMIQVYEYYISHHLAKAFESLFGSVTCLPGW